MKSFVYFILIPALLPVFIILRYVYVLDRNEREPLGFVLKIVILGALFCIPCISIETFMEKFLSLIYDPTTIEYAWMENTVGVALVEELSKWLVFMIFVWKNKNFNFRYDGIVYAVSASLGFAALENVLYLISFGTGISVARAIFAIPGHATFGVYMGYWLSRAKNFWLNGKKIRMRICKFFSVCIPMFLHGFYDFLLADQLEELELRSIFLIYVLILDFLPLQEP